MKLESHSEKKLTIQDISVDSVSKILDKYETSSQYSSSERRDAEIQINEDFHELNKHHEEAQELLAQELANVVII